MQYIEKLLATLGVPSEKVSEIVNTPDGDVEKINHDDIINGITTNISEKIKNDPVFWSTLDDKNLPTEFLKKVEATQYGRAVNIVRHNLLKNFGMSEKEFDDLGEEAKKIEVFSKIFIKKLSEGKINDKQLQEDLISANQKIKELESKPAEIEERLTNEHKERSDSEKFDFIVLSSLSSVKDLKVPPNYIFSKITERLKSLYNYELNGLNVDLRQKENKNLKVLINNGSEEMTLNHAINKMLKEDGLIDEKNNRSANKVEIDVAQGGGLAVSSHILQRVNTRIKEEVYK